jgi:spore coat protein U-like protein
VTTTPLAFPPYASGTTTPTDTTSTIAVLCTPGTAFTVGLNPGSTTGSAFVERRMQHVTSASATLGYNIYRNAERTEVWADGIGSTFTVSGTGTGLQHVVSFTAYGRMPSGQRVSFGTYTDVITVTLTY